MADIKTKDSKSKTIKTLNKAVVGTQNIKDNLVSTKEKINDNTQNKNEENNIEYGSNQITGASSITASAVATKFNKYGKKSFEETKDNIIKSKVKIKEFKDKRLAKRMEKQAIKNSKGTIKTGKNTIKNGKTAVKTSKEVAIKSQKVAKESIKASKKAMQMAKETAKATAKGIKLAIKATISAIKGIIAGTKALIAAIVAGGWIAVVIILVVCLVALLCGSIFGIFFSSEKSSSNSITMKEVVAECNQEFADKLQDIQDKNPHDDYVLDGSMASWKDILLVYTIKQSNGINEQEVMTMDDKKNKLLKIYFGI